MTGSYPAFSDTPTFRVIENPTQKKNTHQCSLDTFVPAAQNECPSQRSSIANESWISESDPKQQTATFYCSNVNIIHHRWKWWHYMTNGFKLCVFQNVKREQFCPKTSHIQQQTHFTASSQHKLSSLKPRVALTGLLQLAWSLHIPYATSNYANLPQLEPLLTRCCTVYL